MTIKTSACCRLPLAVWLLLAACSSPPPLPVYGHIPRFQLTDHHGQAFDSAQLRGKVWVADFIFTSCGGPCPRMSAHMRQVQRAAATLPEVRLISFTVDPATDTPPVLAAYARRYQAEPGRWYFLTGEQAALHHLGREAFKLHNVDGGLEHSTRLVLLDRESRIRGFYSSEEEGAVPRLIADMRRLVKG